MNVSALLQYFDWQAAGLFGLVLARVSGALMGLPFFTSASTPGPVKAALLILCTAAIYPVAKPSLGAPPTELAMFAMLAVRELAVGLMLGFAVRIVLGGVQLGGQLIAAQLGLTYGSIVHPDFEHQEPALVHILYALGVLVFLGVDGHHTFVRALGDSFHATSTQSAASLTGAARDLVLFGGIAFGLGLKIAAPVMAAVLVSNVGVGIVARAAPQLGIFQVAVGITVLVGLLVLSASMPSILNTIVGALRDVAGRGAAIFGGP